MPTHRDTEQISHPWPRLKDFYLDLPFQGHFCQPGAAWPILCHRGHYQPSLGSDTCLSCPSGSYCPYPGTRTPRPCPAHAYCQAGMCLSLTPIPLFSHNLPVFVHSFIPSPKHINLDQDPLWMRAAFLCLPVLVSFLSAFPFYCWPSPHLLTRDLLTHLP